MGNATSDSNREHLSKRVFKRLTSLDFFRGLTMFLLVAEGARIYDTLGEVTTQGSLAESVLRQFHHHPWNGLRFWDLVQPFFMFIVGVAMWFSVNKRLASGQSWNRVCAHMVRRCAILLALGVMLHCGYRGRLVWELWNVLSQLSFTILLAFLIMFRPVRTQLTVSFGLLLLTEILYRFTGIPGYDQPFVKDHNFGSYMDMILMGKLNPGGGWVAFNCVPTAAHTIWGVLAGRLLASRKSDRYKLRILLLTGLLGLVLGYGMDWAGLTPIIKRICTSSFVIVSGGWCLAALALCYALIDLKDLKRGTWFFIIVGMNPIFIYVFMETAGKQWFVDFVAIFVGGALGAIGMPIAWAGAANSSVVLTLAWGLCYWLYRRGIFIKI